MFRIILQCIRNVVAFVGAPCAIAASVGVVDGDVGGWLMIANCHYDCKSVYAYLFAPSIAHSTHSLTRTTVGREPVASSSRYPSNDHDGLAFAC